MAGTLAEKVWESHVVRRGEGEPDLLYIDLHLLLTTSRAKPTRQDRSAVT